MHYNLEMETSKFGPWRVRASIRDHTKLTEVPPVVPSGFPDLVTDLCFE